MFDHMFVAMTQNITKYHLRNKAGVRCRKNSRCRCVKCKVSLHDICFEIGHGYFLMLDCAM